MKKLIASILAIALMLPVLGGCMSREQREQARQNVATAGPIVEKYLSDYYPGASLNGMDTLTYVASALFVTVYATDLVHANVNLADGGKMEVICDIESGKCYDTSNYVKIRESVCERLMSKVKNIGDPDEIVVNFYNNECRDKVSDEDVNGFASREIVSFEGIMNSDYFLDIDVKYDNRGIDLTLCDPDAFYTDSEATICFTDYYSGRMNGKEESIYFRANEMLTCSRVYGYDSEAYTNERFHQKFQHELINGIEVVWDSDTLDVELSEETAPATVTTKYYSGRPFNSIDGKLIRFKASRVGFAEDPNFSSTHIYFFFNTGNRGDCALVNEDGEYDVWNIEWQDGSVYYQWFSMSSTDNQTEATLGLYELDEDYVVTHSDSGAGTGVAV